MNKLREPLSREAVELWVDLCRCDCPQIMHYSHHLHALVYAGYVTIEVIPVPNRVRVTVRVRLDDPWKDDE